MSLMLCRDCGAYIDTDADPEAFYDSPEAKEPNDYALCEACRERRQEADDAQV